MEAQKEGIGPYLTAVEAAKLFSVKVGTMRSWMRKGDIAVTKVNGTVRVNYPIVSTNAKPSE